MGDKDAKARVDVISPATTADRDALVDEVKSKKIDGFLWIETPQGQAPDSDLHVAVVGRLHHGCPA